MPKKIDWKIVHNIRIDYLINNIKGLALQKKYNVSESTYLGIINNKTWQIYNIEDYKDKTILEHNTVKTKNGLIFIKNILVQKRCTKCCLYFSPDNFNKKMAICKKCQSGYKKEHVIKNKDIISDKKKVYYIENRDREIERSKKYYLENKDKKKAYDKKRYEENKDKFRAAGRVYYLLNKPDHIRRNRNNVRKRYSTDPVFKLKNRVSCEIRKYLNKSGNHKNGSILSFLPYSLEELKSHIQSLFSSPENLNKDGKVWMNWDNWKPYNVDTWDDNDSSTWNWNIDHIKPQSYFHYTSMEDEEFKQCWGLKNLRPLSAKANILKGDSLDYGK